MNRRYVESLFFIGYCIFILWHTIISRYPSGHRIVRWGLFWSYRAFLEGDKYAKKEMIQNLQNVIFFIPFGLLFPLKDRWWRNAISAVLLSMTIEALQLTYTLGWCEIDDVICNSIGSLIGFWIYVGITRVQKTIGDMRK